MNIFYETRRGFPMDYEDFKKEIYNMTKINLSYYKEKQMKRRINSLIKKNNYDTYEDYIKAIKTDKELFNEFINYLTINVSEFYRNPEQWEVLERDILPDILKKTKYPKIWSAACSTGDEPYTMVMILNKFLPLESIRILATDIDKQAIEKAKNGLYTVKSVEKLPMEFLKRYFTVEGSMYKIKDEVKKCVDFKHHDLLKDEYPKGIDLIVCRNVLIYFTEEAKDYVYKKFNGSLKTGGILFVGSTEQILMASRYNFYPIKTFFYVKQNDM